MCDFEGDEVIDEICDAADAYVMLAATDANRFRFEDEVCQGCGKAINDVFDGGFYAFAEADNWSVCYCDDCWYDWAGRDEEIIPLFQAADEYTSIVLGDKYCDYCNEDLLWHSYTEQAWYARDKDGYIACHCCWRDWARGEWPDDDTDEDGTSCVCAECEIELDGWSHVVTGDNEAYCFECYYEEDAAVNEPPPPKEEVARANEDAAGRARNDRDKAKLRARYKDHCAYHLFHAHHRKHQGCTFAAAGQNRCSRGSHGVPDDFEDAQAELETPARA